MDVFQSPVVNFAKLGPLLLELNIKEWMLFGKFERIVSAMWMVSMANYWVVVFQLGSMFVMVVVMIMVLMMLFVMPVALFSH